MSFLGQLDRTGEMTNDDLLRQIVQEALVNLFGVDPAKLNGEFSLVTDVTLLSEEWDALANYVERRCVEIGCSFPEFRGPRHRLQGLTIDYAYIQERAAENVCDLLDALTQIVIEARRSCAAVTHAE